MDVPHGRRRSSSNFDCVVILVLLPSDASSLHPHVSCDPTHLKWKRGGTTRVAEKKNVEAKEEEEKNKSVGSCVRAFVGAEWRLH